MGDKLQPTHKLQTRVAFVNEYFISHSGGWWNRNMTMFNSAEKARLSRVTNKVGRTVKITVTEEVLL